MTEQIYYPHWTEPYYDHDNYKWSIKEVLSETKDGRILFFKSK